MRWHSGVSGYVWGSTSATYSRLAIGTVLRERHRRATVGKNTEVPAEVADKPEVIAEARVCQHAPGVTTHRRNLAGFKQVMAIQLEGMFMPGDRALVDHRLPVVLTDAFQFRQFEQSIGGAVETCLAKAHLDIRVLDRDRAALHQARVAKAAETCQVEKIVPVQRTGQAFAIQHRIGGQPCIDATIRIHVRKIQLAAGLEHTPDLTQYGLLVRTQVDHAIRHHHVKAVVGQVKTIESLDLAFKKGGIGTRIPECITMKILVTTGHGQLFRCHVYANDFALLTGQGGQHVHVTTAATTEIENTGTLKLRRRHQTTTVVARDHLIMQRREDWLEPARWRLVTAGIGL